jgi:hypothetical protein
MARPKIFGEEFDKWVFAKGEDEDFKGWIN